MHREYHRYRCCCALSRLLSLFRCERRAEVLTAALATELGPLVRVNAVGPGTVAVPVGMSEAEGEALGAAVPLRRVGEPEDVSKTVAYLVFDAPYVTGQVIRVDGGRVTRDEAQRGFD